MLPFVICAGDLPTAEELACAVARCCRRLETAWRMVIRTASIAEAEHFLKAEKAPCVILLETKAQQEALHQGLQFVEDIRAQATDHALLLVLEQLRLLEFFVNHDARPSGVLCKPLEEDKVDQVLLRLIQRLDDRTVTQQEIAVLRIGHVMHRVRMDEILYLEAQEKRVDIYMRKQRITIYDTLKNLLTHLDNRFWQCHRSYVVNSDCVRQVNFPGMRLLLQDNLWIPLARSAREEARQRFMAPETGGIVISGGRR